MSQLIGSLVLILALSSGCASGTVWADAEPDTGADPTLTFPVKCQVDRDCWLSRYVDVVRDPAREARDYGCGLLSYHGHKGTDIAIVDEKAMARGVPVVAALDGPVVRTRDGMADFNTRAPGAPPIKDRECGNAVVMQHGKDWEIQYCHLRRDSVLVKPGQRVKAGETLALVGESGDAPYPHLHFEVRYKGAPVDPFSGRNSTGTCGIGPHPLWKMEVLKSLPYHPVALFTAGFASVAPNDVAAIQGRYNTETFPADAPVMYLWAEFFGTRQGDTARFLLRGPDGRPAETKVVLDTGKTPERFATLPVQRTGSRWPKGRYRLEVSLTRSSGNGLADSGVVTLSKEITIP
ncbi:MAG: M23 family metallopeptidase [Alphaproteobacteria bacterium]